MSDTYFFPNYSMQLIRYEVYLYEKTLGRPHTKGINHGSTVDIILFRICRSYLHLSHKLSLYIFHGDYCERARIRERGEREGGLGMHIVLRKKRMTLSGHHAYSIRWRKKREKKGEKG